MVDTQANNDGVLDFEEFKNLHNAAKDDAAGRKVGPDRGGMSRTESGLSAEQNEVRCTANAEQETCASLP